MEEVSLQDIYEGFAARFGSTFPPTHPGQIVGHAALYRNILPQFREAIARKIQEIWLSKPDQLIDRMADAVTLYRRFEDTYAPL
jgi:hypothetical protein